MTSARMPPAERKTQLIAAAVRVAARDGYANMTREAVALAADVSPGLVSRYLGTMIALRRTVMRAAVKQGVVRVIAQGLAARDPYALKAPDSLRQAAAQTLTT